MTREIKFRAQRTDSEQFVEGYYVKILASQLGIIDVLLANARICHVIFDEYGVFWHIKPETLGQLTGLKDKNGKEIYEGSILKHDESLFVATIDCFGVNFLGNNDHDYPNRFDNKNLFYSEHEWEIIGNIYENKELLEAKND